MSILWERRREPLSATGWHATGTSGRTTMSILWVCPTCWHVYTPGHYRAHLRGWMHKERRGWWR